MLSALAGLQAPIVMMSQNRAAARDEALAATHYQETMGLDALLKKNTELTQEIHQLTTQINQLLQARSGSTTDSAGGDVSSISP